MADDVLKRRVEEIGDNALELNGPNEREAYIVQACAGDEFLTAMALEYIHGADSIVLDPVIPDTPLHLEEKQVGGWKLKHRLGEGGFGVVYLAERSDGQVRQLGAMKFLKGTGHNRDMELRFLDERRSSPT
jgi:serine/threonine-protein kinase